MPRKPWTPQQLAVFEQALADLIALEPDICTRVGQFRADHPDYMVDILVARFEWCRISFFMGFDPERTDSRRKTFHSGDRVVVPLNESELAVCSTFIAELGQALGLASRVAYRHWQSRSLPYGERLVIGIEYELKPSAVCLTKLPLPPVIIVPADPQHGTNM